MNSFASATQVAQDIEREALSGGQLLQLSAAENRFVQVLAQRLGGKTLDANQIMVYITQSLDDVRRSRYGFGLNEELRSSATWLHERLLNKCCKATTNS